MVADVSADGFQRNATLTGDANEDAENLVHYQAEWKEGGIDVELGMSGVSDR